MAEFPAGDGNHAVGFEMVEVLAKCFRGIEIVLAEGKGAGGGRSPGIDQRHLHDVKMLRSSANKRAAVVDLNVYVGAFIKMLSVIGIAAAHDRGRDDGIDF